MTYFHHQSPLGSLIVAVMNDRITSVDFNNKSSIHDSSLRGGEADEAISSGNKTKMTESSSRVLGIKKTEKTTLTKEIQKQFKEYFMGKRRTFNLLLHYEGTPFQMKVWNYLRTIPYGQTMSYQAIAKAIGHPKSARAVGTACKHNPILIIIPCHRVVKSSGEVGEYAGGKKWKEKLLRLERT